MNWRVTEFSSMPILCGCSYEMPKESLEKLTSLLQKCRHACANYPALVHDKKDDIIAQKSCRAGDKPFASLVLAQAHLCLLLCMHMLQHDAPDTHSRASLASLVQNFLFVSENLVHDDIPSRPRFWGRDKALEKPPKRVIEWRHPLQAHSFETMVEEYRLSTGAVESGNFMLDDLCHHAQLLLFVVASCCKSSYNASWWQWVSSWSFWPGENLSSSDHDERVLAELATLQRSLSLFTLYSAPEH